MDERGEEDRRIARAIMASPLLARIFAGEDGRRPSARRIAVVAASVVAGLLLAWGAISWLSSGRPRHEVAELDNSDYLAPLRTEADPSTGEATAPFQGFAVSVESDPPGAIVTVAGIPRGEAPVLAGIDCRPGKRIEVRAEKAGFAPARTATSCRRDTLVKMVLRLRR